MSPRRPRRSHASPARDADAARPARYLALISLLRSLAAAVIMVVLYFLMPLHPRRIDDAVGAQLVLGLALVGALLAWQVNAITRARYPRLRAMQTAATSVPFFLLLFATIAYLVGHVHPGSYSQPMTRLDALYFVVTVFTTVGFGDITPVSQVARSVTIVEMLGNLILLGLIARVVVGAVQVGLARKEEHADKTSDLARTQGVPDETPGRVVGEP